MKAQRAKRIWHVAERGGSFYAENQFGGFRQFDTRGDGVAAIEADIARYGDEWAPGAQP
ncbi:MULTISPECIES: hypothetical protein [Mycolicibacter]|uniref:hypothetical protein n=1 Tax=Mycolicibacter TaxID=1073531 RepID=UPI0013FDA7C5|nr:MULTISPECIES: hypothetical protein [Mycolicibacter]